MENEIDFINPYTNILINKLFDRLKNTKEADFRRIIGNHYYQIHFKDNLNHKCPFTIMIPYGEGNSLFVTIGKIEYGATILGNIEIIDSQSIENITDFLNHFLTSPITESKIYCRGKLKEITYKIEKKTEFPIFTYLHGSYLFCFNKTIINTKYEQWTE